MIVSHTIHRYTGRQTVGNVGVNGGRDRRTTDRLKKEENEEEKKRKKGRIKGIGERVRKREPWGSRGWN